MGVWGSTLLGVTSKWMANNHWIAHPVMILRVLLLPGGILSGKMNFGKKNLPGKNFVPSGFGRVRKGNLARSAEEIFGLYF
jgi:hypothetical protein